MASLIARASTSGCRRPEAYSSHDVVGQGMQHADGLTLKLPLTLNCCRPWRRKLALTTYSARQVVDSFLLRFSQSAAVALAGFNFEVFCLPFDDAAGIDH